VVTLVAGQANYVATLFVHKSLDFISFQLIGAKSDDGELVNGKGCHDDSIYLVFVKHKT
jgi:hypothetical protein